jgi:protein-disulfide isomerase
VADGTRAGVTGTPAFFVNGRLVSGVLPVDSFVRLIDEELGRVR